MCINNRLADNLIKDLIIMPACTITSTTTTTTTTT
ncbi:hypothetical protein PPL_09645 [Heterostelium album PN500]|uniref:Uncharacterized protein n=1 Tax=Heterostelium pallidum (strain ATCC 26659 / Pp 5 / PN500) TaxID=670386 RepID=D3BNX4_HETP5|nr:hypothetical protein PPL_09645 [Heterostelium album PN500]EFA76893.1 hypothetical protein PPL_09645 [Heterostelium album PN500]|eukprot:XP_020429025.1 hypothetical protein PPL_09645 [Heterostelium album PN500]